jgi:hypothetical protein
LADGLDRPLDTGGSPCVTVSVDKRRGAVATRIIVGLVSVPLLIVGLIVAVIAGVMTESGASDYVLRLQASLVFAALCACGIASLAGLIHAATGGSSSLRTFVGAILVSMALIGLVVLGFSTWCTDCGSL